jgi:thiol:disulfide interchange protein
LIAFIVAVALPAAAVSAAPFPQEQGAQEAPVYDESADAAADIAAALEVAAYEHKRVLIQWGANWCGWCILLHDLFREDRTVARKILYEYEVVYVDIGRWDKHLEVAETYGADFASNGVPYLTVLDGDGNVVTHQETGSLEVPPEEGQKHDPEKVLEFLTAHQADYLNAEDLLQEALAEAGRTHRRVFLTFGAPW